MLQTAQLQDIEPAVLDELYKQQTNRFWDFDQHREHDCCQQAFIAGATFSTQVFRLDEPPAPRNFRESRKHKFWPNFEAAMRDHIKEHAIVNSWTEKPLAEVSGQQILGCQWVFTYKVDSHDRITKCKARLLVRGDQQEKTDLPTRAATLASNYFRVLLALVAKFGLETAQLDAINAFVHADLDETVYMKLPPNFTSSEKVLKLNKTLYGLRRSPLLRQKVWTTALKELGFTEIPQEPCVMLNGGIVCFFFVDDIMFAYKGKAEPEVKKIITALHTRFRLTEMGP